MSSRPARAEAPAIEYGEVLRKSSMWFACRAHREEGRHVPDEQGTTLMYFASEQQLLGYFRGLRRKAERVGDGEFTAARTYWLAENAREDENSF